MPALDEDMVVERAFQRMLADPNVRPALPRNVHELPVAAKRAMVMMYADITGVDILGSGSCLTLFIGCSVLPSCRRA